MNILLIATRDPRGPTTGRKMVLRTIIRSLTGLNHRVTVFAFGKRDEPTSFDERLGAEVTVVKVPGLLRVVWNAARKNLSGRLSLNECLYYCPRISRRLREMVRQSEADLVVADMIRTAEYAAETGLPWFVDLDDLLSSRYESWGNRGSDGSTVLGYYGSAIGKLPRMAVACFATRLLKWEAAILRRREIEVAQRASGVSLVSEPEARQLAELCGRPVCCLPMAIDVAQDVEPQLANRPLEMAFTGGLDYKPNLESLEYYVDHVVPALRDNDLGHLRLNVFGQCTETFKQSFESDNLKLHGYVEDLYQSLVQCQLFLAPLQSGSGVKTKIVEAMLLGLPVVTTPIGIQGLDVRDGEHCYVWQTPNELIEILRDIDANPQKAANIARAGMNYAQKRFSPNVLRSRWAGALGMLTNPPARVTTTTMTTVSEMA